MDIYLLKIKGQFMAYDSPKLAKKKLLRQIDFDLYENEEQPTNVEEVFALVKARRWFTNQDFSKLHLYQEIFFGEYSVMKITLFAEKDFSLIKEEEW